MITGKTLINLGYKPGQWFTTALAYTNEHQLEGQALIDYLDAHQPQTIDPHEETVPYHRNIRAESERETENVASVFKTMDAVMKTPTVIAGAVMPDACPTGGIGQIPVGGVVVAKNAIHPAMHSADICCSVMMTNFGDADPKAILDAAHSITHFGGGGRDRHNEFPLPKAMRDRMEGNQFLSDQKSRQLASSHLGTQGDGNHFRNHFLYVGRSEATGDTIMVTHHGSRGLGAYLYNQGMRVAEGFRQQLSPKTLPKNAWIPYHDEKGRQYWEALQSVLGGSPVCSRLDEAEPRRTARCYRQGCLSFGGRSLLE